MKKIVLLLALTLLFAPALKAQILAELYRNINCGNCTAPDNAFENFMDGHPEYGIIPVFIHNSITFPGDPFYNAAKEDIDYRSGDNSSTFYQLGNDPTGVIMGVVSGSDEGGAWEPTVKEIHTNPIQTATVTVSAAIVGADSMSVEVRFSGNSGGKQVKPYAMLIESNILYHNTKLYGNPPNDIWNNVFRGMLPDKDGGDAFTLSGDKDFFYGIKTTGKEWKPENMKVVAFLQEVDPQQDNVSRLIVGVGQAEVQTNAVGTSTAVSSTLGDITPNPATVSAAIPFSLSTSGIVEFTITDALGRTVATIGNTRFSEGKNTIYFAPENRGTGMYLVSMKVDGQFVGAKKMIFE